MRYLKFLIFSVMLVMIVLAILDKTLNFSNDCANEQAFKNEKFSGTIHHKFFDKKNHNFMTIVLNNKKSIVLIRDTTLYSFVNKNDSLNKQINTDFIVIYRNGKGYTFDVDFGCSK